MPIGTIFASASARAALGALALGVVLGVTSLDARADTYKWITFKPQGAGDAQAVTTQWFADEFKKRTGGKHEIEIFWGGSVAKVKEIPDALSAGVGDFGDIVTPYFPDKFVLNNAVGFFIPQPKSSVEIGTAMGRWHEVYPQFEEELARYNLKAIGYRPLEDYGMLCTQPIRSLDDFQGKRIRTYGFAYPALVEALGGTPVSISTSEAYEALERGILDCTPIGPSLAHGWKYDEVAKYYIEVPLGASFGHMLTMNLDSYNKLDEQTRAIVDGLGAEYSVEYAVQLDITTDKVLDGWAEKGVEVIPFPREQLAKVIDNDGIQKVRQEWIERAKALGVPAEKIAAELRF